MSWTLAVSAAVDALGALAYVALGRELFRRGSSSPERKALRAFAIYWTMTGAYLLGSAIVEAIVATGATPIAPVLAFRYVGLALACAGLAGLLYYFAYLGTGQRAWRYVIAIAYTAILVLSCYQVWSSRPTGVLEQRWRVDLTYDLPIERGAFAWLLLGFLAPPIFAAVWYMRYLPRAGDPLQRYRIVVVSLGIAAQLASNLFERALDGDLLQLLTRPVFGVLVAALVLSAYRPPVWLKRALTS